MAEEKFVSIAEELIAFHKQLKQPKKDKDNPFFRSKYVPLENVVEVIDEALKGTGLTYVQLPITSELGVGVKTILMTKDERIESDLFMPSKKADAQQYGSVITYARRYALSACFGITSDEDDDGVGQQQAQSKTVPKASNNGTVKPSASTSNSNTASATKKNKPEHSDEYKKTVSLTKSLIELVGPDLAKELGDMARVKSGAADTKTANDKQLKIMSNELQTMLIEKQAELKKSEENK